MQNEKRSESMAAAEGIGLALIHLRDESARAVYDLRKIHVLAETAIYFFRRMINPQTELDVHELKQELTETGLVGIFHKQFAGPERAEGGL